mmetsp:Transcript_89925/g.140811  ORF Transcript_89925/g.140811 Transcript_89925/m.140811 type:complete len:135 (+) Transcript_89925:67-471(+)
MGMAMALYGAHTVIEAIAGSLLFIRGKGMLDTDKATSAKMRLYRRWHGAGLLALSSLGGLIIAKKQLHTEAGKTVSIAFAGFHAAAVAAHFWAYYEGIKAPQVPTELVSITEPVFPSPHALLAVGFAAHTAGVI